MNGLDFLTISGFVLDVYVYNTAFHKYNNFSSWRKALRIHNPIALVSIFILKNILEANFKSHAAWVVDWVALHVPSDAWDSFYLLCEPSQPWCLCHSCQAACNLVPVCDQFSPFTTFPSSVKTWLALPSSAPLAKLLGICAVLIWNDGTEFGGSIYQKVNKKLETAVNLAWTGNSNTRTLE